MTGGKTGFAGSRGGLGMMEAATMDHVPYKFVLCGVAKGE